MVVSEIYPDIVRATGLIPQEANFRYATDACEILANLGQFEILLGYLDITIPTGTNLVALPREVDSVLKVNIDGNPAFGRDRLYEFTMNGPGSNTERVDFSWEERGTVPIMVPLPLNELAPAFGVYAKALNAHDDINNPTLTVTGRLLSGEEVSYILTVNSATPIASLATFKEITRVTKDVTIGDVALYSKWYLGATGTTDTLLATYKPDETEPAYRQIRLSKSGVSAHILFKRKTFRITTMNDFIPVKSKRGLLYMIQALRKYDNKDRKGGDELKDLAVDLAMQEQKSTAAFIELAGATEIQPIKGLNINNRDSLIVADVYDDADRTFGKIGEQKLFDKITETVELLSNKGHWDARIGYVDIQTDQFKYVTLPRYVEAILALNICNQPAEMRNSWFEFHLNGPGGAFQPCGTWTPLAGDFVTFRDVNYSQKLVAIPDLSSDIGTVMRGFGYYQGKRIMTLNATTGEMEDGFPIDVNMSGGTSTNQFVDRIERITKAKSNGFIKLLGFDSSRNLQVTLGYYWPDETEPRYKRIRLSRGCSFVRIKYRLRTRKITSLTDPLHLSSKTAVTATMSAVKLMDEGKFQEAAVPEMAALKYLEEEQRSNNPLEFPELEVEGEEMNSNFVTV